MPIFLDTRGESVLGVGICDRCSRKFPLTKLYSDPNTPGLKVCEDDLDEYDPYRLASREVENIALPFVRPDVLLEGTSEATPIVVSPATPGVWDVGVWLTDAWLDGVWDGMS